MGIGVLKKYGEFLPLTGDTPMFSLGEGDTPLVKSNRLGKELGCKELYFKLEGCNPTGSFKDRGMVVAIAKAVEEGAVGIMCASTGNTSASAAAYSAYLDLRAFVLIPKGEVALGKLAQAMAYGAPDYHGGRQFRRCPEPGSGVHPESPHYPGQLRQPPPH